MTSTITITKAAAIWYPIMLAQERGEISEAKAAELLSMNIVQYRDHRESAIQAVMAFIENLPSPIRSIAEIIAHRPDLFTNPS